MLVAGQANADIAMRRSTSPVSMHDSHSFMMQVQLRLPEQNPSVAALYGAMAGAGVGSEGAKKLFHTCYHKREKTLTQAAGDW